LICQLIFKLEGLVVEGQVNANSGHIWQMVKYDHDFDIF